MGATVSGLFTQVKANAITALNGNKARANPSTIIWRPMGTENPIKRPMAMPRASYHGGAFDETSGSRKYFLNMPRSLRPLVQHRVAATTGQNTRKCRLYHLTISVAVSNLLACSCKNPQRQRSRRCCLLLSTDVLPEIFGIEFNELMLLEETSLTKLAHRVLG